MDILLQDNGDGAEVVLEGGDLKGDGTLFNAVYLSLFSGDCYSNAFETYETTREFEDALLETITKANLKNVEAKANKLLKWLLEDGVAQSIDVFAFGSDEAKINVEITIIEPSGNDYHFAIIWENQKAILKQK